MPGTQFSILVAIAIIFTIFSDQFTQILFVVCPCCYRKVEAMRGFFSFSHPKKGVSLHDLGQGSFYS